MSKILTFFLALLVLFSSVSFTLEKHFCGGQIYSESLFGKAEKCGMEEQCCVAENNNLYISKKSCCKDEIQLINGSIFKKESTIKLNNKQQYLSVFVLIDAVLFSQKENKSSHFKNYFPPPNTHNLNILYQVFRI
ncbi:MAG: HYC_CC_PP family protein [Lutibacter sp.]